MSYNAKNYTEQGGEKTVIGGEIVIEGKITVAEGGQVEGITEKATTETAGTVRQAANVALAEGEAPTKAEFDALINALIEAGLMAEETTEEPTE